VKKLSDTLVERGKKNMVFDALDNPDQLSNKKESGEWTETQLFQFGLLSYLLPRYLVMMGYGIESGGGSDQAAAANLYDGFDQWGDNNSMPCQFEDGLQFVSWSAVNAVLGKADEKWKIAALPSQAVTARWLPNLEGILTCAIPIGNLYGVAVSDGTRIDLDNPPSEDEIYSSGDSQSGENGAKSQPYILDRITCLDGWGRDFYYYSPPPYQGYRLWSAGANGKTFPPWIPDEQIKKMSNENVIRNWLSDDIVHMSN